MNQNVSKVSRNAKKTYLKNNCAPLVPPGGTHREAVEAEVEICALAPTIETTAGGEGAETEEKLTEVPGEREEAAMGRVATALGVDDLSDEMGMARGAGGTILLAG